LLKLARRTAAPRRERNIFMDYEKCKKRKMIVKESSVWTLELAKSTTMRRGG
jgi:hypothetical protein